MTPNLVAKSLPASIQRGDRGASPDASYQSEMSDVCIRARYSDSDEEYELVQKEESNLLPSFARQRSYGAVSDVQPVPRRNRGGRRRRQYRHSTTAVPTDLREVRLGGADRGCMKMRSRGHVHSVLYCSRLLSSSLAPTGSWRKWWRRALVTEMRMMRSRLSSR